MSAAAFDPVRRVLDNGLTVLHQHNPVSSAVTISISYVAGSALDPEGREGLATLAARGLTRGTEARDKAEIGRVLDDRGAHLVGSAGRHTAGLVGKARDADFEPVLELALECARCPTFPEAEVGKLVGDRLTALREDDDDPATVVGKVLREMVYPAGHPYGRRHRGTAATIEAIVPADLRAFHHRYARADRAILVVVGGVERDRALDTIGRLAGSWAGAPEPVGFRRALPEIPDAPRLEETTRRRMVLADKMQSDLALGFPALRRTDPRYHAATLMNAILGRFAMGGRLGRSVREEQGMAYYTYSTLDATLGPGPFEVRAGVAPESVDRALAAILTEIERMRAQPVTGEELDDARSATVRSLPRTLESNEGMASLLHRIEMFDLGLDYLDRFALPFEAVGVGDVLEVSRELLDLDAYGLAVAGPGGSGVEIA